MPARCAQQAPGPPATQQTPASPVALATPAQQDQPQRTPATPPMHAPPVLKSTGCWATETPLQAASVSQALGPSLAKASAVSALLTPLRTVVAWRSVHPVPLAPLVPRALQEWMSAGRALALALSARQHPQMLWDQSSVPACPVTEVSSGWLDAVQQLVCGTPLACAATLTGTALRSEAKQCDDVKWALDSFYAQPCSCAGCYGSQVLL
jgi:hypothetical protein